MYALQSEAVQNIEKVVDNAITKVQDALQFCESKEEKLQFLAAAGEGLANVTKPMGGHTRAAAQACLMMYITAKSEVQRQVFELQKPDAAAAPPVFNVKLQFRAQLMRSQAQLLKLEILKWLHLSKFSILPEYGFNHVEHHREGWRQDARDCS